jgi:NADPH-dependent curcumin reductase CurA
MTDTAHRMWLLAGRPHGEPASEHFELANRPLPDLAPGEVRVRNRYLSVDPYMRGRMNDAVSYTPPFQLGEPLDGAAVGTVVASNADGLAEGAVVAHSAGWREYAQGPAAGFRPVDPSVPASYYLSALGGIGLTAYAGLFEIARVQPGDVVYVSAAAGAVGSLAGQMAKLAGATRVIGSAGSAGKVQMLTGELGFDAAFNYRDAPIPEQLRAAAPDGIDVYFDNVGGDHLEAAIEAMNPRGRIAVCGLIAQYNATEPPAAPRNLNLVLTRALRIEGFLVLNHIHVRPRFLRAATPWVRDGRLKVRETFVDGIERMPQAFIDMLRGANTGKMIVRLPE